ncbi:MAG: lipase [Mycobacteriaceae bacterium]|nr:lipase [Mycobacteriaceae bacterium]
MRIVARAMLSVFAGWIAASCLTAAAVHAVPVYPAADPDPFYAAPRNLSAHRPGDVLAVRTMPPILLFPDTVVTLIKFRSTNSTGKPIAATTTVLTPGNHVSDGPLLSYQHMINALGTRCAVSRELYTTDPTMVIREAPALNLVLRRGWTVALPDHLGPTSAYGAARLGGQITLDGIRAAQRLSGLGLTHSPVAMAGYSGGGMATAWAAAMAPRYAPELNLVGAAEGGVPMNMVTMVRALGYSPHPAFGLAMAAAIGLEREYPNRLPVSAQLNTAGMAVRDRMANSCTNEILAAGAGHSAMEFAKSANLAADAQARRVVEENSLELYDGVPKTAVFEWHSPVDALLPVESIINTMHRYCRAGTRVHTELVPSPDHLTTAILGLPAATIWLADRFAGLPAPSTC